MRKPARITSLALAVLAALPLEAAAKGPEIFPLSQVRKGQKGYGLTVFEGTTPERFEFEVVGVTRNWLPKMDLILVTSNDPKIQKSGFARGMSGSPLFIEGKVACAFSYGFPFAKTNIGGCTPIEYMIAEGRRTTRGPDAAALASREEWRRHAPLDALLAVGAGQGPARAADAWLLRAPLPVPPAGLDGGDRGIARASLPLSVSGLGPTAFEQARQIFGAYGLEPMQGGGSGDPSSGPTRFEMGGAIGAQLARGDVSLVGTGTVSYIDGNTVLGFGHPFFQFGEVYMPAVTAEVHTVIPSMNMAFKMASPLRLLGALVQDRQSAIVVDTARKIEMIPVEIRVKSPAGEETFKSEVLSHRFLTPPLVGMMVGNAAQSLVPDVTDVTVTIESRLALRGFGTLSFTDYRHSPDGAGGAIAGARALRVLVPLLFNPFAPVKIDRLDIDVTIAYKADTSEIKALRLPAVELPAGERTYIEVVVRPYNGREYVERIPLSIPERLAGSVVKLEVVPGDMARPDVAPPESLADVVAALKLSYPANTLVATIYTPDEGVTLGGKILPNLPDSALDTVRPATSTRRGDAYKSVARSVIPCRQAIQGRQEIIVKIRDPQ